MVEACEPKRTFFRETLSPYSNGTHRGVAIVIVFPRLVKE